MHEFTYRKASYKDPYNLTGSSKVFMHGMVIRGGQTAEHAATIP